MSAPSSMMHSTLGFFHSRTLTMILDSYWQRLSNLLWAVNASFKFSITNTPVGYFSPRCSDLPLAKTHLLLPCPTSQFWEILPSLLCHQFCSEYLKELLTTPHWKIVVLSLHRDANTNIECIGQLKQWMHLLLGPPKLVHLYCSSSQ